MTDAASIPWPAVWAASSADAPEAALVRRAKTGDADAFSELVRRHERTVYNLAYRFVRDHALAEDMAQEAFLRAFRLLHTFRGECAFATWMYRVTCNVSLDEVQRRKKRGEVELSPQHEGDRSVPPAAISDLPELVRRCVAQLPENYALVITLYYLRELPYEEIEAVLQIPGGTLKTWLHRARKQLREIVEKELQDDQTPETR